MPAEGPGTQGFRTHMTERDQPVLFGPYRVVRELPSSRVGPRWVAINERTGENRAVYRVATCRDHVERRRLLAAIEREGLVSHPHLLTVEKFSLDASGVLWAVAPYRGNQEGLVLLPELVEANGGRLAPIEAERALEQLLDAITFAHEHGLHHGPIEDDEILVDRHGSVWIELYALPRLLDGFDASNEFLIRDEVRSVVALGYRLVTGLPAEEPRMPAARMFKKLDRAWDRWFDRGLDASGGFDSAAEALAALPSRGGPADAPVVATRPVRGVLARFRRSAAADRRPL